MTRSGTPWAGVSRAAAPDRTSPSPTPTASGRRFRTRAFPQWGTIHSPAQKLGAALRPRRAAERQTNRSSRGPGGGERAEVQAFAGGRPGGGAREAKSTWATGYVAAARRGPRVRREGAQAAAGAEPHRPSRVRARSRAPRPPPPDGLRPPPQLHGAGARALDRKASQPLRAGARAEGGRARL